MVNATLNRPGVDGTCALAGACQKTLRSRKGEMLSATIGRSAPLLVMIGWPFPFEEMLSPFALQWVMFVEE
ncbi:hypothetical protein BDN67DRAFT_960535 [Paxillus ammoniavirescens]|nr:hypothetical protein BDN67DRAFT_960535 [Paxillus ammoniavirescens]